MVTINACAVQVLIIVTYVSFNILCTLVTMATATILNFCQPPPKNATHYGGYSYKEGEALRGKIGPTLY